MKPIDFDTTGIGYVRQKQNQPDMSVTKKTNPEAMLVKTNDQQLVDFVAMVKNAVDSSDFTDRVSQVKAQIGTDSYVVDLDKLISNLLASDNEL